MKTSSVGGSSCAGCFCLPCTARALPWACSVSYTGFLSCQRILLNSWCLRRRLRPHSFRCEPPAMLIGCSREHPPKWRKETPLGAGMPIHLLLYANPGQSAVTEPFNVIYEEVSIYQPFESFYRKIPFWNFNRS